MDIDTRGLGAGSYPDAPEETEYRTVKVKCCFNTTVKVPADLENYSDILNYLQNDLDDYDFRLRENAEEILIDDIEK